MAGIFAAVLPEIRLRVWGLTHGLVGLYRASALKTRADRLAVQFIADAARALAPAGSSHRSARRNQGQK